MTTETHSESVVPVILCGGAGTRLWPLSREGFPKQFATIIGTESLFQACARRLAGPGYAAPVVVTAAPFRFVVLEQLGAIGIDPEAVIIEPAPRDTGPAVLAAALYVMQSDPDAVLLVAPSDHLIPATAAFRAAVEAGLVAVAAGDIVTFGIQPDRPETGYGYLEVATALPAAPAAGKPPRLAETPPPARGSDAIPPARALWNAGIFTAPSRGPWAPLDAPCPRPRHCRRRRSGSASVRRPWRRGGAARQRRGASLGAPAGCRGQSLCSTAPRRGGWRGARACEETAGKGAAERMYEHEVPTRKTKSRI